MSDCEKFEELVQQYEDMLYAKDKEIAYLEDSLEACHREISRLRMVIRELSEENI